MKNNPTPVRMINNALSLRAKLIIAFVALALLPIGMIGLYADSVARDLINKSTQQDLAKASNQTALQIDSYISGQMDSIRTEAQQPFLSDYLELAPGARAGSTEELNARQILVIFSRKDPIFIKSYALLETHGFNLLDTDKTQIGDYEGNFDYFNKSFTSGLPFVSSILFQKENSFYISAPVRNEQGKIVGVLRARYDAITIQSMLLSILKPENAANDFLWIVDKNTYARIADTGGSENLYKSLKKLPSAEILELQSRSLLPIGRPEEVTLPSAEFLDGFDRLAQAPFFTAYSDSIQTDALITGTPLTTVPWVVIEGRSQEALSQPINDQRRATLLIAFLVLIIAVFAAIFVSQIIAKPVINLTSMARKISAGDLDAVAPTLSTDEVGTLAQAFNSMTEKLRQTLEGLQNELRERKHAEATLKQNQTEMLATNEFLRSIMDSPKGVIIFSLDDQYRYTTFTQTHSETMKKIWGVDIEVGMNMLEVIGNLEDRRKAQANFDRALRGDYFAVQEEYGDAGLLRTWWEDRYSPIQDSEGRITGLTVVVIDITERKKMESALRESEEKFRKMFHSSPIAICISALDDGRIIDANYAYWDLTGLDPDTSIGRNLVDLNIWFSQTERDEFVEKLRVKRSYYDPESVFTDRNGIKKTTLAFYEIVEIGGQERILSMFYDMSEQRRIMEALQLAHKESETLRESLARIVTTFDLKEVVELILDQVKLVIPYDTASVWRVEGEWQTLIVGRDLPANMPDESLKFRIDKGNSSRPVVVGEVPYVLNNNVQEELPDFKEPHTYINSWLVVPLKKRGRIIGLIALDGMSKGQFTEHHADLASAFADQAAIALENMDLLDELQNELTTREALIHKLEEKNKETETMRESLASIVGTFEFSEIINRILDQIRRVVPYDSASIWQIKDNVQILIGERNLPPEFSAIGFQFPIDEQNHALRLFNGELDYLISDNVQSEFERFQEPPHTYINSWLGVPMKARGRIIGLIALDGAEKGKFNERHAQLAVMFADQVAIALENARLFSDLQDQLRKQIALRSASMSISSSLRIEAVLDEICRQICVINDGTSAYIAQYAPDFSSYSVVAEYMGVHANRNEKVSDLGQAYYVRDGAWMFGEDLTLEYKMLHADDSDLSPWAAKLMADYNGRSILYVPLYVQGRLLGHTELWDSRVRRGFTREEILFCRTLSQQAAIAIANANLFEQLQRELTGKKELIAELESKNAELERFTYTVSHDLKSPLFTIRGFLGFLEQDALNGNHDRLQKDMQRITDATEKMQALLNDLLELSRIGRLKNESVNIPFDELARDAVELVQGRIMERGVQIEIQDDLPMVFGDRPRLLEVVQNLVDNASKFMGSQTMPRIEIGQNGEEEEKPILFVRDNGAGIAPEHFDRIFGLFNKLDVKSSGTGIGLALVKRIIEVHNGRIWVQSEPGVGTTFYFTLPPAPNGKPV